jgi:1-pyrroline-5-carboxylate dehydrogenase
VDEKIYDVFTQRLKERVAKISVGDPAENKAMGPVVNESAMKSILSYIDEGKKEGRVLSGGGPAKEAGDGYFIQPTVIMDVPPEGKISLEEIFGPVLAVIKSKNFEDAMKIANNTEFGLTGAIYTSSPEKIEIAKRDFHVGNLYINRKCTGAMVGAHPFGGFNMSGTDSKAGGPDYLYLYTQAKSIGEKLT